MNKLLLRWDLSGFVQNGGANGTDANWTQQPDEEEAADQVEEEEEEENGAAAANLYLTMPSENGLKSLIAHWKKYERGASAVTETEKAWWALFGYLKEIRPWSAKDRIEPVVVEYLKYVTENRPDEPVIVELDLWFRATNAERQTALEILKELAASEKAEVLDEVIITEIKYHAVLVRVPAGIARNISKRTGRIANANGVMSIRPQSVGTELPELTPVSASTTEIQRPGDKPCIGAIIDGYPVEGHQLLDGRLIVIEKDIKALDAPVAARFHGTAMASLVLMGRCK